MRLTMVALAVLWLLRSNDEVFLTFPDADFLFTLIAVVLLLPHILVNMGCCVKAIFRTSGSMFIYSLGMMLFVIFASAIDGQNPTRSLPYAGLATVFIGFLVTTVEVRWRDRTQLESDFCFVYLILGSLVFLSFLANVLGLPSATVGARFVGITSNPNYLGLLAVLTLSMTPAMLRIASSRSARLAVVASSLLSLDVLLASQSRGSMLALLIGYAAYFLIRLRLLKFVIAGGVAIATLLVAFPNLLEAALFIFQRQDTDDEVSSGRIEIYGRVLDLIFDSRFWLHGAGFRAAEDLIDGIAVHNLYLQIFLELGIFGVIAFSAFVISVLASCFRRGAVSVFIIPTICILVFDLTESSLFGFGNYLTQISWLLMGFALAVGRLQRVHSTVFFGRRFSLAR